MSKNTNLIVFAIDNNNEAWYEMLIPFILSIKLTDYKGILAALGYGLDEKKKDILSRNGINLLDAPQMNSVKLSYRRFLDVARIIELNPDIKKVAIYDADIWFPHRSLDLFDLIECDKIHVSLDAVFPWFIESTLDGPSKGQLKSLVVDGVYQKYGSGLQAGLVAGTARAWRQFADFLRSAIERIGTEFIEVYGIDTTLLHLWAVQKDVKIIPPEQNYILKQGVRESMDFTTRETQLCSQNGPIKAIHMSRDVRFLSHWRFLACHPAEALSKGQSFALSNDVTLGPYQLSDDSLSAFNWCGFHIKNVIAEKTAPISAAKVGRDLVITAVGNHEIDLEATRAIDSCNLIATHPSGCPSPLMMEITIGETTLSKSLELSATYCAKIPNNIQIFLRSKSIACQMCRSNWIFENIFP